MKFGRPQSAIHLFSQVNLLTLMVGDGLQLGTIRSRIRAERGYLRTPGRVPHEHVITFYEQMDVLVYPRRSTGATESITPLKPFEALALKKPIIVSDVQPLAEIVGANERGLSFESGNIQDLADTISKLISDKNLGIRLGEAGREWVVDNRNWETVAETFVSAYKRL